MIPILRLNNTLLASIQLDLDDESALKFQTDVLARANQDGVEGIIIDITAMDVVDSFMARVLNDTATMVRLLGVQTVICGMQPAVALTLVEMGRELVDVHCALNLDAAMDALPRLISQARGLHG